MDEKQKKRLGIYIDMLLIGGWCLISAGAALVSVPAGLIVAGALAVAGGILLGRGISA